MYGPDSLGWCEHCTPACEFEDPYHWHCTVCGGLSGYQGHADCHIFTHGSLEEIAQYLNNHCTNISDSYRKKLLGLLMKRYKKELYSKDNNQGAIEIFTRVKLMATGEEFQEFLEEVKGIRPDIN